MKIYLIKGCTGEYDDYREWDVVAYQSEKKAKYRLSLLEEFSKEFNEGVYDKYFKKGFRDIKNPFDPHMHSNYTGVWYKMEEVDYED